MYYTLINDIVSDFEGTLNEPTNYPQQEVNFISGTLIKHELEQPLVYTTSAKAGDAMIDFSKGSVTLMSKRFLEILKGAGVDNLQVFPAIIKSEKDDTIWSDYFAVNVIGIVACADLNKSIYDEIMPGHYGFDTLAIDAKKAEGKFLFRLHEHCPTLIVHNSVLKYIVDNDPDYSIIGWETDEIVQ